MDIQAAKNYLTAVIANAQAALANLEDAPASHIYTAAELSAKSNEDLIQIAYAVGAEIPDQTLPESEFRMLIIDAIMQMQSPAAGNGAAAG